MLPFPLQSDLSWINAANNLRHVLALGKKKKEGNILTCPVQQSLKQSLPVRALLLVPRQQQVACEVLLSKTNTFPCVQGRKRGEAILKINFQNLAQLVSIYSQIPRRGRL